MLVCHNAQHSTLKERISLCYTDEKTKTQRDGKALLYLVWLTTISLEPPRMSWWGRVEAGGG